MVSPAITRMSTLFDLKQIKVLHIEPTTVCQAACPQCARENPESYNDTRHRSELSLADVQRCIPEHVVANLNKMFMCGNFGDPVASKDCFEIYQWFRKINPSITLGLNTNGALKNTAWWKKLAKLFCHSEDYVVFSIDGLEDTNHIYRKNVNWKKLIDNATAFIEAGGSAHWDMLIFEHNEHQVELAKNLAKELGFNWFRYKVSKRFFSEPIEFLKPPKNYQVPNIQEPDNIYCHALHEKSMYLASTGEILPCCWIGASLFNRSKELNQALNTDLFSGVSESWQNRPLNVCANNCGTKKHSNTNFSTQWQQEIQLK